MDKGSDTEVNATLFDARNFYYIGNFMGCINIVLPEQTTGTADLLAYSYYSYFAIDSGRVVQTEIKENNGTELIALRSLHDYIEKPEKREEIVQTYMQKLQETVGEANVWLMTGIIVLCREGQYENALKFLHSSGEIEHMALNIQCLLKLNRVDLAKQILTKMQEKSDDATLTQLSQAWVNITGGGDQLQDAYHIFQEFIDKYSSTPLLLNGQAVCLIGQEKYEEAEDVLKESLAKKHNDYDTLINLLVLSHLTGKSCEILSRYTEQIKQFHPASIFVSDMKKKEEEFDRLCLQYEVPNAITTTVR